MPTLGQKLKAEREKRGWTIADVAAKTRIQSQYFEAIERDDTSPLPGGFFYRSFVRQYARLLEMSPEEYEGEMERHLLEEQMSIAAQPTSLPDKPLDVPPLPTGFANPAIETRKWLLRLGGLALVILVCSLIYSLSMNWKTLFGGMPTASAPEPPVAQVPEPARQEAAPPPAQTPSSAPPEQAPSTTPPVSEPASQPPAPAPAAETAPVTLSIRAIDAAWVQVRDSGKVVYSNVIPVGETRTFSSSGTLRVLYGNAGGVEVSYNGRPTPPPGPKGQVRTLEYSAEGMQVIVKPPTLASPAVEPKQ